MAQPITYLSELSLRLAKFPEIVLYSDGFMNTQLQLNSFHMLHGNLFHDYHNSVFKVIPILNYKYSDETLKEVITNDFSTLMNEQRASIRKQIVQNLLLGLEGEINSNVSQQKKLRGVPLVFSSSQFHLIHVGSLKFLTLNDENIEDLKFSLMDFPSEGSVLKFLPSLNFQRLRTNVIFDGDPVIICSQKLVCNRPPLLCTSFKGEHYEQQMFKTDQPSRKYKEEIETSRVWGSVEEHTRWRIKAFYCVPENQSSTNSADYLHVGQVMAINLSEMHLYLNIVQPRDIQQCVLDQLNRSLSSPSEILPPTQPKLSRRNSRPQDIQILRKLLIEDLVVSFTDIGQAGGESKTLLSVPDGCYWKIEAERFMEGGRVEWNKSYRFRNFLTGRYLQVKEHMEENVSICIFIIKQIFYASLTSEADENTVFQFCPIQNTESDQGQFIAKDSFFYLMHLNTQKFIGISEEDDNKVLKQIQQLKLETGMNMKQITLSDICNYMFNESMLKENHFNTYRIRRIDFHDTCETSMLLYQIPSFMEAISFLDISQVPALENKSPDDPLSEEELYQCIHFSKIFSRVFNQLQVIIGFQYLFVAGILTDCPKTIGCNQNYSIIIFPQMVLSQNMFPLMCWLLMRTFPNRKELNVIGHNLSFEGLIEDLQEEGDFMIRAEFYLNNKTIYEHKNALNRLHSMHIKRKMLLSLQIYAAIKEVCKNNPTNQLSLLKFIDVIYQQVGYGDTIIQSIKSSFCSNLEILSLLPQTELTVQQDQTIKKKTLNFLEGIIIKMMIFPRHSRPDIIEFLSGACACDDTPMFLNQDVIYRTLLNNQEICKHTLMTLSLQDGKDLYLEYLNRNNQVKSGPLPDFFEQFNQFENHNFLPQLSYLCNQLQLYAKLCMSRNIVACAAFTLIFPLDVLNKYIGTENLGLEVRGLFVCLMRNLYIDREPYQIQNKPDLIKIFKYDKSLLQVKQTQQHVLEDSMNRNEIVEQSSMQAQLLVSPNRSTMNKYNPQGNQFESRSIVTKLLKMKQQPEAEEIEIMLNVDPETTDVSEFFQVFKKKLLDYMKEMHEQVKMNQSVDKIYHSLTLEILKIILLTLQFGFWDMALVRPKRSLNRPQDQDLAKVLEQNYQRKLRDYEAKQQNNEVEQLINFLASLLEYDENYFLAVQGVNLKRSYQQIRENKENFLKGLKNLNSIASLVSITEIFKQNAEEEDSKVDRKQTKRSENEIITDPLFKKIKSLQKIVQKANNKTFSFQQSPAQNEINYEVLIKVQICKAFQYLIDIRQDYLLDNCIGFFRSQFIPKIVNYEQEQYKTIDWSDTFEKLLPEEPLIVGEDYSDIKLIEQHCDLSPLVRNIDAILKRPFYEVLIVGLYFSKESTLKNEIVELMQRYSCQKKELINNINELQLMVAPQVIEFQKSWCDLLKLAQKLPMKCQAWLQFQTPENQNQLNELSMSRTLKLLEKVYERFSQNLEDERSLDIKQKLFRHVGSFDNLFFLLVNALQQIDRYQDIFLLRDPEDPVLHYQMQLSKIVVKIIIVTLKIYSIFCINNFPNQINNLKRVVPLILPQITLNLGGVEYLVSLFKNNRKLVELMDAKAVFKLFVQLIQKHGKYSEFLHFFEVVQDCYQNLQDNPQLSQLILSSLINHRTFEQLNPFKQSIEQQEKFFVLHSTGYYSHPPRLLKYKNKFLVAVAKCFRTDISANKLQYTMPFLPIDQLLKCMLENSQSLLNESTHFRQFEFMAINSAIADIIMVLVEKTTGALSQFTKQGTLIQQLIELEIQYLDGLKIPNPTQINYIFYKQMPFLTIYFEVFFSDLTTQIFGGDQNKDRRRIINFGQVLLKTINFMSSSDVLKDPFKVTQLKNICSIIGLQLPTWVTTEVKEDDDDDLVQDSQMVGQTENESLILNQFEPLNQDLSANRRASKGLGRVILQNEISKIETIILKFFRKFAVSKRRLNSGNQRDKNNCNIRKLEIDPQSERVSTYWQLFIEIMCQDEKVKLGIKDELKSFSDSLWNLEKMFQKKILGDQKNLLLDQQDLIVKLLSYIEFWKENGADINNVEYVLRLFKCILNVEDEEEQEFRQNMFDQLGVPRVLMNLLSNEMESSQNYQFFILDCFNILLNGGNVQVQQTILDIANSSSDSEKFFYKINSILQSQIISTQNINSQTYGSLQVQCVSNTLKLLQLLCEGHNLPLQKYLHQQTNSKNSYNLLLLCIQLLTSIRISNNSFAIVIQCVDTITEMLQGPCRSNQITVSKSKFLEYAVQVLSEDEKIFETMKQETQPADFLFTVIQAAYKKKWLGRSKLMDSSQKYDLNIHPIQLSRLKYKVLICVLSLIEGTDSEDTIILRLSRSIPFNVLAANLSHIYRLYDHNKTKDCYEMDLFNRATQEINLFEDVEEQETIIEIGFMILTLIQVFLANEKCRETMQEDTDTREVLKVLQEEDIKEQGTWLFNKIKQFIKRVFEEYSQLKKDIENLTKSEDEKNKLMEIKIKQVRQQLVSKAVRFFKSNSKSIEVMRDNSIIRIYFPKLPFCNTLSKDLKNDFHDNVSRESAKSKLTYLMSQTKTFVQTMEHEEWLRILFNYNPVLGRLANNLGLIHQFAFYTMCIINLMVMLSYSQYFVKKQDNSEVIRDKRLNDPRFMFQEILKGTELIIVTVGVIQLVFASIIVFFFLLKRAPLKIYSIWIGFTDLNVGYILYASIFIFRSLKSLFILLQDADILYYSIYILACIIGLTIHPFLFAILMMDFLKLDQLKTVIQAMWQPRIEIGLALMLLLIMQYYFTIVSWLQFYLDYEDMFDLTTPRNCQSFWKCYIVTIDWTFKFGGSIGGQLTDYNTILLQKLTSIDDYNQVDSTLTEVFYYRFIYDNMFNIVLVFILSNMLQGIIIDTFGSLREQLGERLKDQGFICFICSFDMEKIDKSIEGDKGFYYHIKHEHYMWDYLFYRAYLEWKNTTEFSGIESYIYEKIQNNDLDWFPIEKFFHIINQINRALCVKEEKEDEQKQKFIDDIKSENTDLTQSFQSVEQKILRLKELSTQRPLQI